MADSDDILRLGIEAAREGNRDEARGLFTLLTNEDPDNVQAWLWLAGVAQGPEQRRAALEQVVRLDPNNEMALKGLQAMGVTPPVSVAAPAYVAAPAMAAAPVVDTTLPARELTDEERYAAELDSAFDLADELPRTAPPRRDLDDEAVAAGAAAGAAAAARTIDDRPRVRSTPRVRTTSVSVDDDDTEPARSGPSPLLWLLLGLILLALLGFLLWQLFFSNNPGDGTQPTAAPIATTAPGGPTALPGTDPTADPNAPVPTVDPNAPAPTVDPNAPAPTTDPGGTMPTADPNAPVPTVDPNAPAPTVDPNAPAPTTDPNAQPTPPPPTLGPVAGANPLVIPAGAFITANGWNYTYPGANVCAFGCSVVLGNRVGNFNANGTFLHVLAFAQNTTGTAAPLPADFFVLRDAQGRTHEARVDVADAAWRPGSADVSHGASIPANSATTSVYLVFDVPTDATNLVLFSRYFIDQGWQVASSVR
jgi:hypothetical protein